MSSTSQQIIREVRNRLPRINNIKNYNVFRKRLLNVFSELEGFIIGQRPIAAVLSKHQTEYTGPFTKREFKPMAREVGFVMNCRIAFTKDDWTVYGSKTELVIFKLLIIYINTNTKKLLTNFDEKEHKFIRENIANAIKEHFRFMHEQAEVHALDIHKIQTIENALKKKWRKTYSKLKKG